MHTSLAYSGSNLTDLNSMLTQHFGPSTDGSWNLVKVAMHNGRIETRAGDIYFSTGDTIHIKRTSILVEKAK